MHIWHIVHVLIIILFLMPVITIKQLLNLIEVYTNMVQYQTEAILLSTHDWSHADRMVTLFSRLHGKITAIAYGARRPKNTFSGSIQSFTYLDLVLSPGKNLDCIKQCEIKNSFREIRENLHYMAYGAVLAEITSALCPEKQPENGVFELLLAAFKQLTQRNPRLVILAAAWQLLSLTGFRPEYNNCVACGTPINHFPAFFDATVGGLLCCSCRTTAQPSIFTENMQLFLDNLLHVNLDNPTRFTVSGTTLVQIEKILFSYLHHCLERPLKSVEFIQHLSELDKLARPVK